MARSEFEIKRDIQNHYLNLEPESLTADGERAPAEVMKLRARLKEGLKVLFKELGREVSEQEAFSPGFLRPEARR